MAEVIELLSSSPPRPTLNGLVRDAKQVDSTAGVFDFASDDFNETGDFDFESEQPAKKRKLEPSPKLPIAPKNPHHKSTWDSVFDLSSIGDHQLEQEDNAGSVEERDACLPPTRDIDVPSFSSSAPELSRRTSIKQSLVLEVSSDHEVAHDPVESSSQVVDTSRVVFSQRTANLLATVRAKASTSNGPSIKPATSRFKRLASAIEHGTERPVRAQGTEMSDLIESSQQQPAPNPSSLTRGAVGGKQTKAAASSVAKALKEAERATERERKKLEKEARLKEKQKAADIAEVNKSKIHKKNSTPEMIVDMPNTLRGSSMANQIEEYMKELEVTLNYVDYSDDVTRMTESDILTDLNIIRWRRRVVAEYDDDLEIWRPLSKARLTTEEHVLIYLKAEAFAKLAVTGTSTNMNNSSTVSEDVMRSNLDKHIAALRARYTPCRPIFLLEGLNAWLKKSFNAKNRAYTAAVRAQPLCTDVVTEVVDSTTANAPASTEAQTKAGCNRRKKSNQPQQTTTDLSSLDASTTEMLLLHLQLQHQPLLIHHTTSPKTSASQISAFTQHLSTRPYRLAAQNANLASASFCMTTGQIRTGSTTQETWIQMLQEINRVTPSMAYGIVGAGHTNPVELVRAFRDEGRLMLEDVRKSANKDGAWSDRRLGPMVSKRIHKVFTGKDPAARDGMA